MLRVVGDSKAHDDPEVEVTIVKATHDAIARMVENGKEPDLSLAG